jgi:hypothetical protein
MPVAAFIIVAIGALLGSALGVMHLQSEGRTDPPWLLAALHGIFGIGGFACLVFALRGNQLLWHDRYSADRPDSFARRQLYRGAAAQKTARGDTDRHPCHAGCERLRHPGRLRLCWIARQRSV